MNRTRGWDQGGSMARFTLANKHLYAVDHSTLHLFNVQDSRKPVYVIDVKLGFGIETVFHIRITYLLVPIQVCLFFDISTASEPTQLSRYAHIRACDPVVVNDKYAFVTLRTGSACGGQQNLLEVVDIQDLKIQL
jgi:hypothetical protein